MDKRPSFKPCLELPLPVGETQRAMLVIIRRMAAHGFRDAAATMLALETFGTDFERVLVLLRAYMIEVARASKTTIKLAPCCAMGMTEDEDLLIEALVLAEIDSASCQRTLSLLTRNHNVGESLSVACYLAESLRRQV